MLWNHHRIAVFCTGVMTFLSASPIQERHFPARYVSTGMQELSPAPSPSAVPASSLLTAPPSRSQPYTIYLTFDDGPSAGSELVNELSQKDSLEVNVFLIGRNVCLNGKNRELFREYQANPLVEIGNHSYSHAERHYTKYFRQPSDVLADFDRSRDSLRLDNGLIRLPGRNFFRLGSFYRDDLSNGKEAADTLAARGYQVFGWDLEWRNRPAPGFPKHSGQEMLEIVTTMLEKQKTFLPGHLVVLLHDPELRDEQFKTELEDFIRLARSDGRFRFEHLSRLAN